MKPRLAIAATVLGTAVAIAGAAQANDSFPRTGSGYDNYHRAVTAKSYSEPVRLQVKYRLNGHGSVPLRRLIASKYNIDTRNYDLRSVSVRSKQRRDACADLQIGHRSSGSVYLREGVTRIDAPRARGEVPWTLHVADARVRQISVVLVPKHDLAYSDRGRYNSGYAFQSSGRTGFSRSGVTTRRSDRTWNR